MKYTDYIKYLKSQDIILFDHDYRISFNNINNYYRDNLLQNNMNGGGNNIKLKNINKDKLIDIINVSISSNPEYLYSMANY
jgi:hypothetical protein